MYDHYERQQDEHYRRLKEKRAAQKRVISMIGKSVVVMLLGNAFAFVIYAMFLSKLVSEKLAAEENVAVLVCAFGMIAQLAVLVIASVLTYVKNEGERRLLLDASRESGFAHIAYYLKTWKRVAWALPSAYLIIQLPFMIYYTVLGYYYQAETLFAHFFIPQLAFCELTHSGILGGILNALLLAAIYGVVVWVTQKSWLKNRIRA